MSSPVPYSFFQNVERSFDKAAIFTNWDLPTAKFNYKPP